MPYASSMSIRLWIDAIVLVKPDFFLLNAIQKMISLVWRSHHSFRLHVVTGLQHRRLGLIVKLPMGLESTFFMSTTPLTFPRLFVCQVCQTCRINHMMLTFIALVSLGFGADVHWFLRCDDVLLTFMYARYGWVSLSTFKLICNAQSGHHFEVAVTVAWRAKMTSLKRRVVVSLRIGIFARTRCHNSITTTALQTLTSLSWHIRMFNHTELLVEVDHLPWFSLV